MKEYTKSRSNPETRGMGRMFQFKFRVDLYSAVFYSTAPYLDCILQGIEWVHLKEINQFSIDIFPRQFEQ